MGQTALSVTSTTYRGLPGALWAGAFGTGGDSKRIGGHGQGGIFGCCARAPCGHATSYFYKNYDTSRARRVRARARESRERAQLMEQLDYHLLNRQFVRRTATGCSMRA
jgi:hypothetical protein